MIPAPARRGRLVLASATLFLLVGAAYVSAPLVALGGVALSALMSAYLAFYPTAILLRRKKIELSWWVPPGDAPGGALTADRPFAIHVALRNHGARRLRLLQAELLGTSALELPRALEATVPAGRQVELTGECRARAAGYQVLHGAVLTFGDVLGLFEIRAYFPNPIAIKVFPRSMPTRAGALVRAGAGAPIERGGLHQVRRRGLAGELREIREHGHGDPFKSIAWKATARRGKLMVRDLETEIVVTHQLMLDVGGSMRGAIPGASKLDHAIETATALARAAIDRGDRVGLCTFDSRIYSELPPGDGHHHYLKLVDRLLETHDVVDEDLTDLTGGELVGAAARYLLYQEALDVRLARPPSLDDPAWERIVAGPGGELYDVAALARVVTTLLEAMGAQQRPRATRAGAAAGPPAGRAAAPAWWWTRLPVTTDGDAAMARLRLFCRLRGIELPYRTRHGFGQRARGLLAAARRLAAGPRADVLVLISDLVGAAEDPDATAEAVSNLRRAGHQVVVAAPFGPDFLPAARTEAGRQVAEVLAREVSDQIEHGRRQLLRAGIPVIRLGPGDGPAALLGRLGARPARARGAA